MLSKELFLQYVSDFKKEKLQELEKEIADLEAHPQDEEFLVASRSSVVTN